MSYSKNNTIYVVECQQQDGSYEDVYTTSSLRKAKDYVHDHKGYKMRIQTHLKLKSKHHGFNDFYERS